MAFPFGDVCNCIIRGRVYTAGRIPRAGRQRARHKSGVFIVGVQHRAPGVGEQPRFALAVFIEIFMLGRSDVVFRQVGENAEIEFYAIDAPMLIRLRRHFDHRVLHALLHHFGKRAVEQQALRRSVMCRCNHAADIDAVCADISGSVICISGSVICISGSEGVVPLRGGIIYDVVYIRRD